MIFQSIYSANAMKLLANQSWDIEFKIVLVFDAGLGQQKPFCTISKTHKFLECYFQSSFFFFLLKIRNIKIGFTISWCILIYPNKTILICFIELEFYSLVVKQLMKKIY